MPARAPLVTARAVLALGLLAAGLAVALLLAGGLVAAAVLAVPSGHWALGALSAAAAALVVRWLLLLRVPPVRLTGIDVRAPEQPALNALAKRVADRVGAPAPRRVCLVAGVEVVAIEEGGVLGLGAHPVLGIGLGLIALLGVSELEAALAHELGHRRAGGRAGGLLHRARAVLARAAAPGRGGATGAPFRRLCAAYLRATLHLARAQELQADRAAIQVAGAAAHLAALERAARGAVLFTAFLADEVEPLVAEGHQPENLYDGFRAYEAELTEQGRSGALDRELARAPAEPEGLHPPLAARLAFARAFPDAGRPGDARPARSLLLNAERLERELTARVAAERAGERPLAVVPWAEVGARVYGPRVERAGRAYAARVAAEFGAPATGQGALAALLPTLERRHDEAAALVLDPSLASVPVDDRTRQVERIVSHALGALVGLSLVERGGAWRSEIGRPVEVALGRAVVAPLHVAEEALADRSRLAEVVRRAVETPQDST
ncbi:M48 family metalloprotease [Anaeromyxobacter dehalogenans]|uniref:Peptidase M48, Ste24p n=1 Tax=Anaeromyxobacter dehalogenans (strain 2CP-C) TaxID=290397 RepID=Q2IDU6_ANADE|nr:M48 family metalloprotease [Anaeromyxobacter dehalogenans]ABC82754.1 peptidase M48, Ste24p [Anaeromyxobacter dehalogenans 2CP-C]